MCHGHYSTQLGVRVDSVAVVWRAIAEIHLLEGLQDPRKLTGSTNKDLGKRLSHMILHYSYADPPSRQEKETPLALSSTSVPLLLPPPNISVQMISSRLSSSSISSPVSTRKTQSHHHTTQFRFQDLQFHNADGVILHDALDQAFLDAWKTTLFLGIQKNCVRE